MKPQRLPSLLLAALLQALPVGRLATSALPSFAAPGLVVLLRCVVGAAALLGSTDAVSGASSAISGLANLSPTGPVTQNATGTVTTAFAYRIVVSNPGSDHAQDYWNATPLPPGLTINTNMGGNGRITGTPTEAGAYAVRLAAANDNFKTGGRLIWVYRDVTITVANIGGGGTAPEITTPPHSLTVTNGDSATFSVTATGDPAPTFQWRKDGANLSGANTATLTIPAAAPANAGGYDVVVANSSGSRTSLVATLTVLVPPEITTQPQSLTVTNGDSATFSVTATGDPAPTFQWRKDSVDLAGQTAATFTLTSVQASDAGDYTVVVRNSAGTVTSAAAHLTVEPGTAPEVSLGALQWANGHFSFQVSGANAGSAITWITTDLTTWTALSTNPITGGTLVITDPSSGLSGAQFYRVTLAP